MDYEEESIGNSNLKRRRVLDSLSAAALPSAAAALSPSAVYSSIDRQMVGVKAYKRRSSTGRFNVKALEAIVGLAASGYFTPRVKKRKTIPPQTALGFISVPSVQTLKRKR